jgi:hypothetical protein
VSHEVALGILTHMNRAREIGLQYLRGALPYPDLLQRSRIRRRAGRLITCKRWPGADATGTDAAQPALTALAGSQVRGAVQRQSGDVGHSAEAGQQDPVKHSGLARGRQ